MAGLLDRALQRKLLEELATAYPSNIEGHELARLIPGDALRVNMAYLEEHDLVKARFYSDLEHGPQLTHCKITAKGIDFLSDDGGLGAILGVVTIKLHEQDLQALIASRIQQSALPQTQKQQLTDQLRKLPAETTKHLAMKLVDTGLQNWPAALQLLQNAVG
ncbi:hypothetical protein [Xanthomonas arboricola]|uniref:hypothetical protein n=1 Tax=Xanthomonas arboricola TaxID=56448 RepID=UPI000F8D5DEF|nr:hypothetical protein [Xanthomonas arboricola]